MYKTKYILPFENDLNEFYEVYFDYLDYAGKPTQIFGAEDCLTLRSTTGDEDRFASILGTECLINIIVGKVSVDGIEWDNNQLQIYDLISQHDNDIRVTVYREQDYTKSIFQGFIVVEDNNQPFLDPPFTLSIRALDGLGLLKGVDFVDTTGNRYVGSLTPLDWIAQILYKTGQKLNIRSYFNIINIAFPLLPPIEAFTINVNTFQTGQPQTKDDPTIDLAASAADDCYTALEKIVRCLRCRLFQQDGVWNLVNLWEYQNLNGYTYTEYSISDPVGGLVSTTAIEKKNNLKYDIQVGADQIIHPVRDDTIIYLKLATKSEKLTYTYDQSLNKICNQGLTEGDLNPAYDEDISSTVIDATITPVVTLTTKGQDLFCYDHFNGTSTFNALYPSNPPTERAFIRIVRDSLGYETLRFGVIDGSESSPFFTYVRSTRVLIDTNDIFQMTMSWRFRNDFAQNSAAGIAAVYLYGIDGTFWVLRCVDDNSVFVTTGNTAFKTEWVQADSNFRVSGGSTIYIQTQDLTGFPLNIWNNITINNTQPAHVPISGEIEVMIVNQYPTDGAEMWFKDLSVTILPYLQGSYRQVKGDFNFSSSNNNVKQTDQQDVQISDSPKRYFKGALLQPDGKSLMPPTWIRSGFSGETKRFTQLMEQIIYNAIYRQFQKIEGSKRGLICVDSDFIEREAGYINSYYFSDHDIPTKRFMLTSFEKDYATGEGRHVFVEILADQNDTAQVEPDRYIFQYIFQ